MRRLTPILIILLLAAATRIINVSRWPAWTDEGWSTWAANEHTVSTILDKVSEDRHPPLYFLSLSAWWSVAGDSRLALRFLSIISGILTTAVVYRLGADWLNREAAAYGALLYAVLDVAIYYSQEIRHYGWLMLAVCLMMLFFLRYLRRPQKRTLVFYTLSTAFMFYVLYIGVFVLAVQGLIGLFVWRGKTKYKVWLCIAWAAALLLYFPWILVILRQANWLSEGIAGYSTNLEGIVAISTILFGGQAALMIGLYLIGTRQIITTPSIQRVTLFLSGGGLLILSLIINLRYPLLSARTMVYITPMLMIVCGYGASLLPIQAQRILIGALLVVSLSINDFILPRLESDKIASAVAQEYSPGDAILLENGWDDNAVRYEMSLAVESLTVNEPPTIIRTLPFVNNRGHNKPVIPEVEGAIKSTRRVWVVNWYQPSVIIPFLDAGNDGYRRVMQRETPVGAAYTELYHKPMMQAVLYEQPDTNKQGKTFGDTILLNDAVFSSQIKSGQPIHIDLWWSTAKFIQLDYSSGVFLMDESGTVKAQQDGPLGEVTTTKWETGKLFFDRHTISEKLAPGKYKVGVHVYWYGDQKPLLVDGKPYVEIGETEILPAS